jgi:hypothetical protein
LLFEKGTSKVRDVELIVETRKGGESGEEREGGKKSTERGLFLLFLKREREGIGFAKGRGW